MQAQKIAFLGNMNNNHFSMVRYLREKGLDVELLLFNDELEHFQPKADTYCLDYMDYVKQLNWGSLDSFIVTSADEIKKDLSKYQVLVGCGLAPAYCYKAGITLDIFKPYGFDIWGYTRYKINYPWNIVKTWPAVYFQKKGIEKCRVFHMSKTNALYEKRFNEIIGNNERWNDPLPLVYAPEYNSEVLSQLLNKTHWGHVFREVRANSELMVISHMRHVYGKQDDPSVKGNDILLKGWQIFLAANPELKSTLVLIDYGQDTNQSKVLIEKLDIKDSITWLPKMYRKDIMPGLMLADIVCGEFVHSWVTGGVLFEALVAKKPILAWRDEHMYASTDSQLYKILNAHSAEDIAARLQFYINDSPQINELGAKGSEWYSNLVVDKVVKKYITYINQAANNENVK